jgi:excisionase family DNA binding protein
VLYIFIEGVTKQPQLNPMKTLFTIEEASEYLRLPKNSIYKYTCKRKIPFLKFGKRILFDKHKLDEWLEQYSRKTEEEIIAAAKYNILTYKK